MSHPKESSSSSGAARDSHQGKISPDQHPECAVAVDQAEPPSYHTLYGQAQEVRNAGDLGELFRMSYLLCSTKNAVMVLLAILSILPIAMIVIGSMYVYQCPAQRYIPIYLIVAGSFQIIQGLLYFLNRNKNKRELAKRQAEEGTATASTSSAGHNRGTATDERPQKPKADLLTTVVYCFQIGWLVAGCVWIFRIYKPNMSDPIEPNFCDPVVYYGAVVSAGIMASLLLTLAITLCCCLCCSLCCLLCRPSRASQGVLIAST